MGRADTLAAFRQLLERTQSDPEGLGAIAYTDALVGPESGPLLRKCAIPHEIDRKVLEILAGSPSPEEADAYYEVFLQLSIVQVGPATLSMHDRWRKPLFAWWLRDENRAEFAKTSAALVAHYAAAAAAATSPTEQESSLRKQMYHLIGADQAAGLALFEVLCRRACHQLRFTECNALIRLVGYYAPVLMEADRAMLAYHEGKLAADLRDWPRAEALFRQVHTSPAAAPDLRVSALVRHAHALRQQRQVQAAIECLRAAQVVLPVCEHAERLTWQILRELGETYRDAGDLDLAERTLLSTLEGAHQANEPGDVAGLYNSLGTLYLKRRDAHRAIDAFTRSLAQLKEAGDVLRPSQVQNNLALAYCEQQDWPAAEAAFLTSIELKRQAGDVLGQGLALQNLSRAQAAQGNMDAAINAATQAIEIFTGLKDEQRTGIAMQALGKYRRRLGHIPEARRLLQEAVVLLERAGDDRSAIVARAELRAIERPVGLPWWAWVSLAVAGIMVVLIVVVLIVMIIIPAVRS